MPHQTPSDWAACPVCDGRAVEIEAFTDGDVDLTCEDCGHAETVALDPKIR